MFDNEAGPSREKPLLPPADHVSQTIDEIIAQYMHDSDDDDAQVPGNRSPEVIWGPVTGNHMKIFDFIPQEVGIDPEICRNYVGKNPVDFFCLFITDEIFDLMVLETNRYAHQNIDNPNLEPKARLRQWKDTNPAEMKRFFGILLWMGLVRYPNLQNYWSRRDIYSNKVCNVMSRNRFQILLSMWHFHDNDDLEDTTKLRKISHFLDKLKLRFQAIVVPDKNICIDETLVPFRGRLAFRQYIKNKRHKFGIKLFKLCTAGGYTYNLSVYCGKEDVTSEPVPTRVVKHLLGDLLDKGYTLYTDNYYTSVSLAHTLLKRNTHLIGTLRKNRKLNPEPVITEKLNKGGIIARESNTGVVVSKWKDKRDVLFLSTKHGDDMIDVQIRDKLVQKPKAIVDYNNSKAYIDLSDQMKAYNSSLRRGIKWYRKLAIEMIFGSTIVNAHIVYSYVTKNKISITNFKEKLCEELLFRAIDNEKENTPARPVGNVAQKHTLAEGNNRRRCGECYRRIAAESGRKEAQRKATNTKLQCTQCEKSYCMPCFFLTHACTK